jgi:hypothetical protein
VIRQEFPDTPILILSAHVDLEEQGIDVVGDAASGVEALQQIAELRPEVALIDIDLRNACISSRKLALSSTIRQRIDMPTLRSQEQRCCTLVLAPKTERETSTPRPCSGNPASTYEPRSATWQTSSPQQVDSNLRAANGVGLGDAARIDKTEAGENGTSSSQVFRSRRRGIAFPPSCRAAARRSAGGLRTGSQARGGAGVRLFDRTHRYVSLTQLATTPQDLPLGGPHVHPETCRDLAVAQPGRLKADEPLLAIRQTRRTPKPLGHERNLQRIKATSQRLRKLARILGLGQPGSDHCLAPPCGVPPRFPDRRQYQPTDHGAVIIETDLDVLAQRRSPPASAMAHHRRETASDMTTRRSITQPSVKRPL